MFKSILIALAMTVVSNAVSAGDFKLTHGGKYSLKMPTVAYSYDGKRRDISKFYKADMDQFYIGGQYTFDNKSTAITTTYDNGYNAMKYDVQRSARVGIKHVEQLSDNMYVSFAGDYKFGGDSKHTPCTDSFNRQYYCGNATAWSDFDQKGSNDGEDYNLGIRFTFTF